MVLTMGHFVMIIVTPSPFFVMKVNRRDRIPPTRNAMTIVLRWSSRPLPGMTSASQLLLIDLTPGFNYSLLNNKRVFQMLATNVLFYFLQFLACFYNSFLHPLNAGQCNNCPSTYIVNVFLENKENIQILAIDTISDARR